MAGGFGGRGAPLHARTRAGAAPRPAPEAATGTPLSPPQALAPRGPDVPTGCPARHCWVTAPVDGGAPRPGLLLEWRRTGSGWEGRVAYAAQLRAERWGAVEEWLPAEVVASVERTTLPGALP